MKFKLSILFLLFATHLCAQDVISPDDVLKKKEINSIKLAGEAIYADTYQEVSADEAELAEAHRRSKDLLKAHVIEIFAKRLHMEKKDVQEIWTVLENRCENIIIKKGDLCRVFTYVMKNAIGASLSKNKGNEEVNKEEVIAISESFGIPAQIVGRVEACEQTELIIKSEFGEFRY